MHAYTDIHTYIYIFIYVVGPEAHHSSFDDD